MEHQDVLGPLACMETYGVDSAVARARCSPRPSPVAEACVKLYAHEAHERAWSRAFEAFDGRPQ